MSRYFMTIPEAVELVLVAGAMGRGREIFVLEMGSPLRIWDLAGEMARLKGLEPGVDIELRETGLRPGEKLQEELFQDDELREATEHPRITRTIHPGADPSWLRMSIENLENLATDMDLDAVRRELARVVVEGDAVAAHELMPTFEESTLRHDSHPERTRRRWSEPAIESAT
jgi:FlaA1/EpsC-like NDP-sugar epimerase